MKKFATARTLAVCLLIGAASTLYAQFPPADPLTRIFFLLKDLEMRLARLESQIKNPGGGDAVVSLKQLEVTLLPPQLPLPPPPISIGPEIRTGGDGPPTMIPLPKADVPVRVHFICLSDDAFVELDGVPVKLNLSTPSNGAYSFPVFLSTATNTIYGQLVGVSGGAYSYSK